MIKILKKLFFIFISTLMFICFIASTAFAASPLPAPKGLKASATSSTLIKISWTKVTGAKTYIIYRSTSSGGTYSQIGTTSSNTFGSTGLIGNTRYYYKVKAKSTSSTSPFSSYVTAVTLKDSTAPRAPINITVEPSEDYEDTYNISWNPNKESDLRGYYVYLSDYPDQDYSKGIFDAGNYLLTDNSFELYDVKPDETVYLIITAVDTSGNESEPSEFVYASKYVPIKEVKDFTYTDGTKGKSILFMDNLYVSVAQPSKITVDYYGSKKSITSLLLYIQNNSDSILDIPRYDMKIEVRDKIYNKTLTQMYTGFDKKLDETKFEPPSSLEPGEHAAGYLFFDTSLELGKVNYFDGTHKALIDIP